MLNIAEYWKNYIDNQWVDGGSERLSIENPATGEHLAWQAVADRQDVAKAVSAAKACHESGVLNAMRPVERGRLIRQMGKWLLTFYRKHNGIHEVMNYFKDILGETYLGDIEEFKKKLQEVASQKKQYKYPYKKKRFFRKKG